MARTLQGCDIAERQLSDIAQRHAGDWAENCQGTKTPSIRVSASIRRGGCSRAGLRAFSWLLTHIEQLVRCASELKAEADEIAAELVTRSSGSPP
jgi:hypothetical protein